MPLVNTIISTLFVLVFLSISLGLNETVYSSTDLSKLLDHTGSATVNCVYNSDLRTLALGPFGESDEIAREALYGTFSARGAAISVYVLGAVALLLGLLQKTSIEPVQKFKVELFNIVASFAGLAAALLVILTSLALTDQSYVPSARVADNVRVLDTCKDADDKILDNVVQRSERLQASVVFGIITLLSIGYMAREIHAYQDELKKDEETAPAPPSKV